MGKEVLTEQRISDDCKKAIRRFFWRSIILIAVAPIAILIPYLIHILEQFTEEGFPPLPDICMILYVCPTLAIIIYEITKNVIVTVHLLRKGFGVAEDEVISVKHVHKGGQQTAYKLLQSTMCLKAKRKNKRNKPQVHGSTVFKSGVAIKVSAGHGTCFFESCMVQ